MKKLLETLQLKWPEYLFEMKVIYLGIFGAIILNNWNENIKDRKLENQLLEGLKVELINLFKV